MNRLTFRYTLGSLIMFVHFGAIGTYMYIGLNRFLSFVDTVGLVLAIAPLTALYSIAFFRFAVADRGAIDAETVPTRSCVVQIFALIVFSVALWPVGAVMFVSGAVEYKDISVFVGLIETLFGVYMAYIFNSLFPETMADGNAN